MMASKLCRTPLLMLFDIVILSKKFAVLKLYTDRKLPIDDTVGRDAFKAGCQESLLVG